ncbi:MAG: alpha/beta fold hydrolase [bacterium]
MLTVLKYIFLLTIPVILFSGCGLQRKLLYYPGALTDDELNASGLKFWPSEKDYRGLASANEVKNKKGVVIVFHGNAGSAVHRGYYINFLEPLGYKVILAEYPAYGGRAGKLSEKSFVRDAKETIRQAYEKFGEPLFLLGESLGCGVVSDFVSDGSVKINGIVLVTPWDTLLAVARSHFSLLPVKWFMKDKYNNIDNLRSFQGRVAIIGTEQDDVIPVKHAVELYKTLSCGKKMWIIKGAGHNDWPMVMKPPDWKDIMSFVSGNTK